MAFDLDTQNKINQYISIHVASEAWHVDYFDFISDSELAQRIGEEFISTRYIYKLLEGLKVEEWLLRAQIRIQILSYASIYEAVLHHLLFDRLRMRAEVISLIEITGRNDISIPREYLNKLEKYLMHDQKKIIPTYEVLKKNDIAKIRFDKKAECAAKIGLINASLKDELIEFYEARNAIHIHAEIKKNLIYQLELSKKAYLRMKPFKEQISNWLSERG